MLTGRFMSIENDDFCAMWSMRWHHWEVETLATGAVERLPILEPITDIEVLRRHFHRFLEGVKR